MRVAPRWWVGLLPVLVYAAWVLGAALYQGIDYRRIGAPDNLLPGLIVPLSIAAIALVGFLFWSGWAKAVFFEATAVRRPVFLAILLLMMGACAWLYASAAPLAALDPQYLAMLALAMLLVGVCEEVLNRGVLLVGLRGSCRSEVWVWFWSSLVFGSLHAMNGLLGVGAVALLQVVLAFCAGSCLYLLRRLTGSLFVPIVVHAAWDFSTFIPAAGHVASPVAGMALLMVTYIVGLVLVALFFRHHGSEAPR